MAGPAGARDGRPSGNVLTAAEWREDLGFLVKTVAEKHRHPFDKVDRSVFDQAAAELGERIPGLADHEVVVGLARLVALLRDGHSRLTLPVGPGADTQSHSATPDARAGLAFRALPVQFYLFGDGLYVLAASPEHRELVGAKILEIGGLTAEAALEAVRPVVAYDSESWVKMTAPQYLRIPEVLHACGVGADMENLPLVLEKDGRRTSIVLRPLAAGPEPQWVTFYSESPESKPLYLKNRAKPFWFEHLEDSRTLYVQVNAVQNDKEETLGAFSARLKDLLASPDVARVVLDLRFNGGGNNYLNRGLVMALAGTESVNRYGRLFTIIGRNTFSAAISLVSALEQWTETIFVGEPAGNSPSQYGDARKHTLPHSGLSLRLSSVYWRDWSVNEKRPGVEPDLKAGLTWTEYREGRDPAMEAILAYSAPVSLADQLQEKWRWGGMEAAQMHYYRYRNSPRTGRLNTENDLISLAAYLAGQKQPADGIQILKYCLVEYPDSYPAALALGRLHIELGDGPAAAEALKTALRVRPGDFQAAEELKKAENLAPIKK